MTHVGARAIYKLGTDVAKAREMGSYRLVERLGQGGMGEVWRAKHRMLARPAAIKLVRPEVLEGGGEHRDIALKRFTQEAHATASMQSPHTIELYDFGVSAEGTFYYVMELLDGFDLETLVQKFGPVPAARAVHLLRQVCHSLAEAHEHGLIHRDPWVHGPRTGTRWKGIRCADGLVRCRVRCLLALDRTTCVPGFNGHGDGDAARPRRAVAAIPLE